ncbi:MAG: adenine deaminase [Actinobacteria bacterium]|nr:adenine deaminase [Actinomycetota bacterium]
MRRRLKQVALGEVSPDVLIVDARLLNVYSGEIIDGCQVAVAEGCIAWVGRGKRLSGPGTRIIDAGGAYLSPGFIDVHGHADFLVSPVELAKAIVPLGTTAMLSDTHDIGGALGRLGLEIMIRSTEDLPFHYFLTVPAHCPPLPEIEGRDLLPLSEFRDFLGHPRVLAVSELTAWTRLLAEDVELTEKIDAAREAGLRLEGHTAGCSFDKLAALAGLGITSCHESVSAEDVLHRLRLGFATVLRHGSIRADLDVLSTAITANPDLDTARVMLTPDWMSPQDVVAHGYMESVVEKAIACGIPPIRAYQMATINPATYLRIDHRLGGIGPGREADLIICEDLEHPRPRLVMVGGKVVAEDGLIKERFPSFPKVKVLDWPSHRVPPLPVTPAAFALRKPETVVDDGGEFTAVHMVNKTVTRPLQVAVAVTDGFMDENRGRCIAGVLEGEQVELMYLSLWSQLRHRWLTVPLSGWGAPVGGLAATVVHETHAPLVLGSSPQDMALAVNRMFEIGGGIVLVEEGKVQLEMILECGGLLSTEPLEHVAAEMTAINRYLQERGCPWDDPFFGMNFLTFTGLPFIRLTPSGLLDSKTGLLGYP